MHQKYLIVANTIMGELPLFTNKDFNPKDTDECIEKLKNLIDKKGLSEDWIDSVYQAAIANQAIYINLDDTWKWLFLTCKGTKKDLFDLMAKMDLDNFNFKKEKRSPYGTKYYGTRK